MAQDLKRLKKRRNKQRMRRKPINFLASLFTTMTMYCGIACIFAAIKNDPNAPYWIFAAIVFDTLDGAVARMTKSVSEFGKQLDSICDVAAFGAAPAVLIFTTYVHQGEATESVWSRIGEVVAIIYVISGGLRLARYNVYQSDMRDYFRGLPIPAAAATVASFVLFTLHMKLSVAFWVTPMTLLLSYLMVSTLRYPKDKLRRIVIAPRSAFPLLALCGVAIAIFHIAQLNHPAIVLFPLAASYVLYGIIDQVYLRLHKPQERPVEAAVAEAPAQPSPPDVAPPSNSGDLL
jgi:CDP-diacylglycerol--serine O-phosphatidyltransferase